MSENNEQKKEDKEKQKKTEQEKKESTEKISGEEREEVKIEAEEGLERLKLEAGTARDRMLRTAADYENYKKRAEKEKREFMKYATERFVKDLLPTMDDLERAINSSNDPNDFESFKEGVQIIYKQLNNILAKYNVTPIEAVDKQFDPNLHEAIMHMPSRAPENSIVQEYQKGYMLHDRVIRASKVIVSAGSSDEEGEDE